MKNYPYIPDPLNVQASVLVDAQTDIKTAIKQGVLSGAPSSVVRKRVQKIINAALARIRSPTLKEDARKSLMRFADGAYGRFKSSLGAIPSGLLPAVVLLMKASTESGKAEGAVQMLFREYANGIPLQEFQKTYIDRVSKALEELAEENALDPNDFRGINSLRNLAEMQVRYERHLSEIAEFREKGTRLVVCSVHGDCSDRCSRWQGRVYSLDGTYGVTADGRHYVPLEVATDIYYMTKAGRTYKNGLLGFNCRHKLSEYQPNMAIPTVPQAEQRREYAITKKQRAMERSVIAAREKALMQKDANVAEYRKWRSIAIERNKAYKQFSKEHGRAFYPDRVRIL
ncbi:MAG: hypothetical protein HFE28_01395 [Clostridia bacterium]|nr:hypothetical protein [Clostridia bacterium]